jgi:anthranilate synthase component 1
MKIKPDITGFRERSREGNLIPVWSEIMADMETPVSVYRKMADGEFGFLLESVEQGENMGRYSFIGCNPEIVIQSRGNETDICYHGVDEQRVPGEKDPIEFLREFMGRYQPVEDPDLGDLPFRGGSVGYMAWDLVRHFEDLPKPNPDDLQLPETCFMVTDKLIIFDHLRHRVILLANAHITDKPDKAYHEAVHKIELMAERLRRPYPEEFSSPRSGTSPQMDDISEIKSNFTREEFQAGVERVKEYIRAGDAFQVVISQRFQKTYRGDPFDIYRSLRTINPSPYMFFLKFGDLQLAGSSPEILVRVVGDHVVVRPIAGTRRRGKTREEDLELEKELLADPKERAEHIMLVDLGRNDTGRVADAGSVEVNDLMVIERYSHVMHIVSNVQGKLKPDLDAYDALAATFPAGTLSGAPKIRAMEIIDEIENVRRGPYGGAVGYFSYDGDLDTCIILRTAIIKNHTVYVQAGAGIVADSIPENEYEETRIKAMAMIKAVEMAESGME